MSGDDLYGGTFRIFEKAFKQFGIDITYVDMTNLNKVEKAITKKTKMFWLESPTNPLLKIFNISELAKMARKAGAISVVDNTFMSPYFQRPIELGADVVVHSATKYLGGHSDLVGGAIVTSDKDLAQKFAFFSNTLGGVASPFDSYMTMRSLKTLGVRMRQHELNAMEIAKYLEEHPQIEKVLYPGLKSHPQHALAKSQMSGFGGMVTIFIKGGMKRAIKFMENVKVFALAESLGGVESLVDYPTIMTHASVPAERRHELGIEDNLVRLSIGIEDVQDLLADLDNALRVK